MPRAWSRRRRRRLGRSQILVNNAGIQHVARVEEFPIEKWDAIIAINLSSAFHTTAAAIPAMRQASWGRIVNIASAHGLTASPFKSAYVAAKHGLVGFTKTVALELAEEGVTCNAICPGYVLTPLVEKPDRRPDEGARSAARTRHQGRDAAAPADARVRARRGHRRDGRLPLLRRRGADHRHDASPIDGGWTAL